jgi:hypothetical protein
MFQRFDDLTLARWLVQTLGHFNGGLWRYSHPLVGAYKLAAQTAHHRQIWLKRLVEIPDPFTRSECCRAPLLPLVTRDVVESGLICIHCNEAAFEFGDLGSEHRKPLKDWSAQYAELHQTAHLEEVERAALDSFDDALDEAADRAASSLLQAESEVFPVLLEVFPSVIWEDHDECLELRPEDLVSVE